MRTTLDIEKDVLQAAKEMAVKEKSTAGAVLSRLARRGLSGTTHAIQKSRNGVPLLPSGGEIITMEHIQRLMDEDGV